MNLTYSEAGERERGDIDALLVRSFLEQLVVTCDVEAHEGRGGASLLEENKRLRLENKALHEQHAADVHAHERERLCLVRETQSDLQKTRLLVAHVEEECARKVSELTMKLEEERAAMDAERSQVQLSIGGELRKKKSQAEEPSSVLETATSEELDRLRQERGRQLKTVNFLRSRVQSQTVTIDKLLDKLKKEQQQQQQQQRQEEEQEEDKSVQRAAFSAAVAAVAAGATPVDRSFLVRVGAQMKTTRRRRVLRTLLLRWNALAARKRLVTSTQKQQQQRQMQRQRTPPVTPAASRLKPKSSTRSSTPRVPASSSSARKSTSSIPCRAVTGYASEQLVAQLRAELDVYKGKEREWEHAALAELQLKPPSAAGDATSLSINQSAVSSLSSSSIPSLVLPMRLVRAVLKWSQAKQRKRHLFAMWRVLALERARRRRHEDRVHMLKSALEISTRQCEETGEAVDLAHDSMLDMKASYFLIKRRDKHVRQIVSAWRRHAVKAALMAEAAAKQEPAEHHDVIIEQQAK
jgi:hypothetical protein